MPPMPTIRYWNGRLIRMVEKYDVVILGGGPAALTTAISIRLRSNLSVLVTDSGLPVCERVGESAPSDLLHPLRHLKLHEVFLMDGHAACPGSAIVWGREHIGYNDNILNPMGPSWRLNRQSFDNMLIRGAEERGVTIWWQTRYTGISKRGVSTADHHLVFSDINSKRSFEVQASWVVDATGPAARFARDQGIKKQIDDRLFALACFSNINAGDMTMQTFLEAEAEGWWYAARLPTDRVVCMYVTEAATLRQVKANNFEGWSAALNKTRLVGPILARLDLGNSVYHSFPIYSSQLEQVAGHNWIAVGDAASCYDPVAAQGLYKALTDGVKAGHTIADALNGQPGTLTAYAEGVKARYFQYYTNRNYLYGQEQRWKGSTFWSERCKSR